MRWLGYLERYCEKAAVYSRKKFIASIVAFIDPAAVAKLPSVLKHRLGATGTD